MENSTAQSILETIKTSKNILINMDTRTDYDALCSSLVLNKFINSLGKASQIIHAGKINQSFNKFFSHDAVETETDINSMELDKFDLVIFVDSGLEQHISLDDKFVIPESITTINIDHHISNDMFGVKNYVLHLGSCCSVLYHFFKEINFDCPKDYLDILAVGLITDTGVFKFDSVKPEDFKIAGEMLEKGIKIWEFISKLTSYEYIDQIRYKQLVFKNLVVNFDKKFAYSMLTLEEINEQNIDMNNVFVRHSDLIKYIEGVDFTFVIAETDSDPKYYELSFRSKTPDFDVCEIATLFGGGGHKTGAGAKLYNVFSIEEALNIVLNKLML